MAKAKGTSVSTPKDAGFPALESSAVNNLTASEKLNMSDFMKLKIPTAGLNKFILETIDGTQTLDVVEGIIISQALIRSLYARSFDESGGIDPPSCFSSNSVTGHWDHKELPLNLRVFGEPSGNCSMCPFSQYQTRSKGGGQACLQRRLLLILTKESRIPWLVNIPPSGLKASKSYMIGLQSIGLEFWQVTTSIQLVEARNVDSIRYSTPKFSLSERLPESMYPSIQTYKDNLEKQITLSYANTDTPATSIEATQYPALPPVISNHTYQEIRA